MNNQLEITGEVFLSDKGSFNHLCQNVSRCRLCQRMNDSQRVLSRAAGPLSAIIMFIGEAPGRLGADDTGIPFHGDQAGHNFEELLRQVGIDRHDVFVTNAVLCNPKDERGNNATPLCSEVSNCSNFLRQQIEIIQPRIVVTLGATALRAAGQIENHSLSLARDVRTSHEWFGRKLIPLYHPGQRAMIHRSFANQLSDYQFMAEHCRRLDKHVKKVSGIPPVDVMELVDKLTKRRSELTYFALHKLAFLVECLCVQRLGHRLTRAYFVRQKDGPYCTDLHIKKLKCAFKDLVIQKRDTQLILRRSTDGFFSNCVKRAVSLPKETDALLADVLNATAGLNDAQLKTKVYLTAPMRAILRTEKRERTNMYNAPIDFSIARTKTGH